MLGGVSAMALACVMLPIATPAQALTIDTTYAGGLPAQMVTDFNQVIALYESLITNPITVYIYVQSMSSGAGKADTFSAPVSYTDWYNALSAQAIASGDAVAQQAVASLSPTTQAAGTPGIWVTYANGRALGGVPATGKVDGEYDSTLSFNTSIMDFTGTGIEGLFDFFGVAEHELNEALGIASALTYIVNNNSTSHSAFGEDQFRYSAPGVHSFSTSASATSYFSIDGGATAVAPFNQRAGGDFNDWSYGNDGCPAISTHIQDAWGCLGTISPAFSVASPEATVLRSLGYNMTTSVPEPGTLSLLAVGLAALGLLRRRKAA